MANTVGAKKRSLSKRLKEAEEVIINQAEKLAKLDSIVASMANGLAKKGVITHREMGLILPGDTGLTAPDGKPLLRPNKPGA